MIFVTWNSRKASQGPNSQDWWTLKGSKCVQMCKGFLSPWTHQTQAMGMALEIAPCLLSPHLIPFNRANGVIRAQAWVCQHILFAR